VLIADSPDVFTPLYNEKRTFESDDNRIAFNPSVIRDSNNRIILFYHKQVVSGKLSDTRITNPSGYSINVGSGNGTLNGISKAWSSASITAIPNVFQLVYVDLVPTTPVVDIASDFPMTFTKSVIPLAYVFSGSSSITRLIEVEKTGNYIYARRQKPDGSGGWSWDDYEDLLNSGEQPSAVLGGNRIYITYTKDSSVYQRIIEVGNENNAWDFLLDYQINTNIINPSEIPFKVEQQLQSSSIPIYQPTVTYEQIFKTSIDSYPNMVSSSNTIYMDDDIVDFTNNGLGMGWYKSDPASIYKYLFFLPTVKPKLANITIEDAYYEFYSNNHTFLHDVSYSNVNTYHELAITGPFYLGFRFTLNNITKKQLVVLPPNQRLYFFRDPILFDYYNPKLFAKML
jgi:hypothetical protein